MALATFYHPTLELNDTTVELSAAESSHAIKSRRLSVGSSIQLINGRGILAHASISETTKRTVTVLIESLEECDLNYSLRVATAIPKGDRQKTMVDMLSQLGVTDIIPLRCERSVSYFKPNMLEKWQRYAIEACKQSQNPWLPRILPEASIEEVLMDKKSTVIYADSEGQSVLTLNKSLRDNVTALIGPEGGFTELEMNLLEESCLPVSFGAHILRTELASVIAASQLRLKDV